MFIEEINRENAPPPETDEDPQPDPNVEVFDDISQLGFNVENIK